MHFNIVCRDLDTSLKFYRDLLGGHMLGDTRKAAAERGVNTRGAGIGLGFKVVPEWRACFIRFGDDEKATVIDLLQWIKPVPVGKPHGKMNHVGIPRVALSVDNIDKAYKNLKAKGVKFISPPQLIDLKREAIGLKSVQKPIRFAVCWDPDGNAIELVE
jgi:catechol 2,3-dioxygenase-like lactoylglutathione lyase family enzyme